MLSEKADLNFGQLTVNIAKETKGMYKWKAKVENSPRTESKQSKKKSFILQMKKSSLA